MYKDLSLKEKAKVIREGVRLGLNSIDDIQSLYDEAIGSRVIKDNNGYYAHSKENDMLIEGDSTGTNITTQGIPFKIAAWDNLGNYQELEPNGEYYFPGSMVREHALSGHLALEGKKLNRQGLSDNEYFSIMEKVAEENNLKWNEDRKKRNQRLLSVDEELVRLLNSNDYDYRGYYTKYPNSKANADTHWTDEFKTVYHPTFSEESRYNGIIDRNYNPYGYIGGSWGNNDEFIPATWLLDNQFQLGGLAKPFSYGDIPDVRYLRGGLAKKSEPIYNLEGQVIGRRYVNKDNPKVIDSVVPQGRVNFQEFLEAKGKKARATNFEDLEQFLDSLIARGYNEPLRLAFLATSYNEMDNKGAASRGIGGNGYMGFNTVRMPLNLLNDSDKLIQYILDDTEKLTPDNWTDGGSGGPYIKNLVDAFNKFWNETNPNTATLVLNKANIRPAKLSDWYLRAEDADLMKLYMEYPELPKEEEQKQKKSNKLLDSFVDFILSGGLQNTPSYADGGNLFKKGGSGIHIKPENRGKFTALKKRTGHSASWFKAHGTPALRKMATFALNSRHWNHKHDNGGHLFLENGQIFKRPLDDLTGRNILTSPILPPKSYYEQFTIPELEPKKPQPLQPLEGTYGNKYSELVPMSDGTYINNPINKGLQLDWRTHALEFAPFLAIGAGPAIGSTATWLASKPALYNLGRMTLGSEIGGRSVDLASNLFTGNTWGLNVGNVVEGTTGWNPNNTIVGLFVTDLTNPGYAGKEGLAGLAGIKNRIKPYWNINVAPKLEQAYMKITHPSYQKVYHGTPVDFDPTKFHSSTNEFGLHVAPQKQVALHFTNGYVNGLFISDGVIKEFYVPKPKHRTIDMHSNGLNLLNKDEIWQHGIGGDFDDVPFLMGGSDFNIKDKDILDKLGLIEGKDYLLSKSGKYTPELINQSYFSGVPNFRYFLSRKDIRVNPREILGINDGELSLGLDDLISLRQAFNISPYTPMQKVPEDVRLSLLNINDRAGLLLYENGIPTIGYWNHSPTEGAQWNYIVTDPRAIKLPRFNFKIKAYGGDLFSKEGLIHNKK